jgi:hypothetical protein
MRPHADAGLAGEVGHALEVALERIEIDQQRRRIDLRQAHAHAGGRLHGHACIPPIDWLSAATTLHGQDGSPLLLIECGEAAAIGRQFLD